MSISLEQIWGEVGMDYKEGLINSESCLQAVLYKVLREHIRNVPYRKVYVEPVIEYYATGSPKYKPDIIICDDKKIIAIIELKFAPNWYPNIRDDLIKLKELSDELNMNNNYYASRIPETGEWSYPEFKINHSTAFIVAVMGKYDSESVNFSNVKRLLDSNQLSKRFSLMSGRIFGEGRETEFVVEGSISEIPIN